MKTGSSQVRMRLKASLETIGVFLDPSLGRGGCLQSTSWVSQQQPPEEQGPQPESGFQRLKSSSHFRLPVGFHKQDLQWPTFIFVLFFYKLLVADSHVMSF